MLTNLEQSLTKEESYVQRRQLFKNIWDTSLHIDGQEDILAKPKIIKTLRMDEIEKCPIGKSKKQRIKNLRHVCNRILDFCNRQEADDQFCERIASAGGGASKNETAPTTQKPKKKRIRVRRKHRKAKSLSITDMRSTLGPTKFTVGRVATKASTSYLGKEISESSNSSLDLKTKRKPRKRLVKKSPKATAEKRKLIKSDEFPIEITSVKRKVHRKKRIILKKRKTNDAIVKQTHILSV